LLNTLSRRDSEAGEPHNNSSINEDSGLDFI